MDSLQFLEHADRAKVCPVYAVVGDEAFLKRQVLITLRALVLGGESGELGLSSFPGDRATRAAVHDELETLPFLAPRRLVVVEGADPFVSRERSWLERYVAAPATSGVLVLEVQSWPSNTRLAKLLPDNATLVCKSPTAARLPGWCRAWCKSNYQKELVAPAAQLLVDLVGAEMGRLDQELAKLSLYVGSASRIESADVDTLVGNSREENTWKIFDLIGSGRPAEALGLLDRLFEQGEDPFALLGAFTFSLRRLVGVARLQARGTPLSAAMDQLGIKPFARGNVEAQLRHLGRRRLDRIYDWLLNVDLGMKGSSQLPRRTLLERLVVRLARPDDAARVRSH
jgi:DNA polymerase-3 subunit delta